MTYHKFNRYLSAGVKIEARAYRGSREYGGFVIEQPHCDVGKNFNYVYSLFASYFFCVFAFLSLYFSYIFFIRIVYNIFLFCWLFLHVFYKNIISIYVSAREYGGLNK